MSKSLRSSISVLGGTVLHHAIAGHGAGSAHVVKQAVPIATIRAASRLDRLHCWRANRAASARSARRLKTHVIGCGQPAQ